MNEKKPRRKTGKKKGAVLRLVSTYLYDELGRPLIKESLLVQRLRCRPLTRLSNSARRRPGFDSLAGKYKLIFLLSWQTNAHFLPQLHVVHLFTPL